MTIIYVSETWTTNHHQIWFVHKIKQEDKIPNSVIFKGCQIFGTENLLIKSYYTVLDNSFIQLI